MQSQVDIDIACTISNKVKREGYKKVILITGDKDFIPMLEYLENDAEFWIMGYKNTMAI